MTYLITSSIVSCNKTLYRLWIAEGFIKENSRRTLEQVADEYLYDLVQRNLVSTDNRSTELLKTCRIHDLMHEIVLSRSDELGMHQILDESYNLRYNNIGKYRRLSIYNGSENVLETIHGNSGVRSIFFFCVQLITKSLLLMLFEKFKLLKVLDLSYNHLECLPKEVGNLFHLKYPSLRGTKVKELPKFIGNLYNLQTLEVRETLVIELPNISKLRNLRYLLAGSQDFKTTCSLDSLRGVRMKEGIGNLVYLQTLTVLEAHGKVGSVFQELQKLRHLEALAISKLTAEHCKAICISIEKMQNLDKLNLCLANEDETLDLQHITSPPPYLRYLVLRGRLEKMPEWIPKLWYLRRLSLGFSKLTDEPLKYLHGLPNLINLQLYDAYIGKQLCFEKGGFPKLHSLDLAKLYQLEEIKIEEGALPLLVQLQIRSSPRLKEVPSNIQHLKFLEIADMPKQFVLGMQPNGAKDHWKVEHISFVRFWYNVQGQYNFYKFGDLGLLERLQTNIEP